MPLTTSCLFEEQKQWDSVAVWSAPPLTLLLFGCTGVHSCPTEPPDCPLLCLNSLQATATPLCSDVHQSVKMMSFYTSLLHEISTQKRPWDSNCVIVCVTLTVVYTISNLQICSTANLQKGAFCYYCLVVWAGLKIWLLVFDIMENKRSVAEIYLSR